jgi:hypothetical protein
MQTTDLLRTAANKGGFDRSRFDDSLVPTSASNICVIHFFGDLRTLMVMSSLLLRRFREEQRGSKYVVLVSWPGFGDLFPYVDEYWSVKPGTFKSLYSSVDGFNNTSPECIGLERVLNTHFEDVLHPTYFEKYYDHGLRQNFIEHFRHVKGFMPAIPSSVVLGSEFNREIAKRSGYKVFIHPTTFAHGWKHGKVRTEKVMPAFWDELVQALLDRGHVPVIQQSALSHNLIPKFGDKCVYVNDPNQLHILSAMRACNVVLDVFNSLSRYAILARTAYLTCDERDRYGRMKEFELDDLLGHGIPKNHVFSFVSIVTDGTKNTWKHSLLDVIISKLETLVESFDRDKLPVSSELYEIIPYKRVREQRVRKFGTRFIKITRL